MSQGWAVRQLPAKYRFSTLCVLTDRPLTEIGYDGPVDVLGVSWGGALAQRFARRYPKRCRRLVLAATSPGVIMFPASLSVLLKMLGPLRFRDPAFLQKVGAENMVARTDATPSCSRSTATTYDPQKGVATSISFLHCGDGAACCGCDACHSPRSSYMGTTIQSSPLINAKIIAACIRCSPFLSLMRAFVSCNANRQSSWSSSALPPAPTV
jgi:hypothetical protein